MDSCLKKPELRIMSGPETGRRDIADTILHRVLQAAARDPVRDGELMEHLRFQEASIFNARAYIISEYARPGGFTLGKCRDHLHFLYLTHQLRRSDDELRDMAIVDSELRLAKPHLRDIYLPGIGQYSPESLFRPSNEEDDDDDAMEDDDAEFLASYIHSAFLENPPMPPERSHPSWKRWLCDFLGVRDQVRLVSRDGNALSESFIYVATHRKDQILGTLAQVWRRQGTAVARNPHLKQALQRISVPCTSGARHPIWGTYLPLPDLEEYAENFLEDDEHFPFLDIDDDWSTVEELAAKWSFLHTDLGVSVKHDPGFLLDIVGCVKEANPQGLSLDRCRKLARLYHDIEAKVAESPDPASVRDIVWTYFADISGIATPAYAGSGARWVNPNDCLWDAPIEMTTKAPMQAIYETVLQCPPRAMPSLASFFQKTLSIPTMGWSDLTNELASLRDNGSQDQGHITRVYERIKSLATSDVTGELRYNALHKTGMEGACQLTGT